MISQEDKKFKTVDEYLEYRNITKEQMFEEINNIEEYYMEKEKYPMDVISLYPPIYNIMIDSRFKDEGKMSFMKKFGVRYIEETFFRMIINGSYKSLFILIIGKNILVVLYHTNV